MVKDALQQRLTDASREGWAHWIRSEADEKAALNGCYFDEEDAQRWIRFIERGMKHTRKPLFGEPFELLDWQKNDFLLPLLGWKNKDGFRRFRKAGVWISKKNGKSTLAGAIVNAFLHMSGPRAECYGFAHTRKQATLVYNEAAAFVKSSNYLRKRSKLKDSQKRIDSNNKYNPDSFYEAREGEAGVRAAEGINPTLIIVDELHVQRSRELWDALSSACAAQEEPLILSISTVGVADETEIWWEEYEYAKQLLSGDIEDEQRFALVYEADQEVEDDPELMLDPEQQRKANPSLDSPGCPKSSELTAIVRESLNSPRKIPGVLRYRFSRPTAQAKRVINMKAWSECYGEPPLDIRSRRCFGGVDISSTDDLTSFVMYFPGDVDENGVQTSHGYLITRFWCPEETIKEHEQAGRNHYVEWRESGHLRVTRGARINHSVILRDIREDMSSFKLEQIGYDRHQAEALMQAIELDIDVVDVNQSIRNMTIGTNAFLDSIEERRFRHDGNKVMRWCCANCDAQQDPFEKYIKFVKSSPAKKIDGAVAASMAFHLAELAEDEHESIYSEPGGLFL